MTAGEMELARLDVRLAQERDRRLARELALGCKRWQLRLDHIAACYVRKPAAALDVRARILLRMGLYQLFWLDRVPDHAAIHSTVELAKHVAHRGVAGLINAVLRRAQCEPGRVAYPCWQQDRAGYLSLYHSHPRWMVERWLDRWGEKRTVAMLVANNQPAPLFIAANTQRTTEEDLMAQLARAGVTLQDSSQTADCLRVDNPGPLFSTQAYRDGLFYVQDADARLAVRLLQPVPGPPVLDLCSAPGGKTIQLALVTGLRSPVLAADRSRSRLSSVTENRTRLGLDCVVPLVQDACQPCIRAGSCRYVLADVPCTGTGTLGRRPDIRWRRSPDQLPALAERQRHILQSAFALTATLGVLVYSTCSVEPEENEMVVERFLECNPEAELEPASRFFPDRPWAGRFIQALPGREPGDGSFAARIRRRKL